jgi:hypothetical protein
MSSITDYSARLRRVCDLDAAFLREYSGLHDDYDGTVADLSRSGVASSLSRLGGDRLTDPHDEAQLAATENAMRVRLGVVEEHRWNPWVHVEALDLSAYERPYADGPTRENARARHLRLWPDVVDNAVNSLDRLSAPVAGVFLPAVRGMTLNIRPDDGLDGEAGRAALERLADHLASIAAHGDPEHSLGRQHLVELLGCEDGVPVDLDRLVAMAEREYARMEEILGDAARRLDPDATVGEISDRLRADHGDFRRVLDDTQRQVSQAAAFVRARDLLPTVDDSCRLEPSPPARSWAPARVSWVAPWECSGHSVFHMSAPLPEWSPAEAATWLDRFNRSASAVVTVHEVGPGHCSHALMMGQLTQPVRRTLWSELFFEGWAHYVEEMMWEEGYQADTPHYQFAMAQEAMMRTVRVLAAVGIHTGALSIPEAVSLFEARTPLAGRSARAEALRGVWEPTYVRYTWGKVLMQELRERARTAWGSGFSLPRFHRELMSFGSPPVGLVAGAMGLTPASTPGIEE